MPALPLQATPTTSAKPRPPTPTPTPDDAAVVASLRNLIVPLKTIDPHAPLDDLAPFGAFVGDARIIGLGESTHGTKEFMSMRHRMIRYLVEHDDLRVVAFEAPVAGIEIVERYIQGELDDPVAAQDGLFYFTIRNTGVWDLIEWLRAYNAGIEQASRVHVVGIDPQHNTMLAPELILDYIATVAPVVSDQLQAMYTDVEAHSGSEHALSTAQMAVDTLRTERDALIATSSVFEFEEALHLAEMIVSDQQLLNEERMNPGSILTIFELRESAMAENVARIVEQSSIGEKVVLWGHNGHVGLGTVVGLQEVMTLGERLRVRYGDGYRVVGFDFASGSFTARSKEGAKTTFATEQLPSTTYASRFQQLNVPMFLLDLRAIDPATPAGWWVGERRAMWTIGSSYTPLVENARYIDLIETFDLLVFIDETTQTTQLPPRGG